MKPLFLGYDAEEKPIHLAPQHRKIHTHVIGSSGSGKSKFLEWMMRGDLDHRQGFCLIDPEGTLYKDVLGYCAHYAQEEVILLNLSKPDLIISYNPFKKQPGMDVDVQVEQCVTATLHAWNQPDPNKTPTLWRTLRLIYTLMIEQNLGLGQAEQLIDFEAKGLREKLITKLQTPLIQKEWRYLNALEGVQGRRLWREEMLSAINRLFPFLTSPTLRRFMGIPGESLDLKQIMDEGKVLLINLAASGKLSADNGRLFGSLLLSDLYHAASRRQEDDESGEPPEPYYCYVDEFQEFVSLDIAKALDRSRKRGLFFILSHQRVGQLEQEDVAGVGDAIDNCKIKVVFGGLGTPGARKMAEEIFIAQLDPTRIKFAIWQTKFWPVYRRDKVYTKSSSRAIASGLMESLGHGSATTAGSFYQPGDWFSMGQLAGTSAVAAASNMSVRGSSQSEVYGDADAESDIPTLFPVPFEELSSIQTYTIDEQLWELTAALKEQYPRHCFIKLQEQKTQPMLVPFVRPYSPPAESRSWYINFLGGGQGARSAADVDRLMESAHSALVQETDPEVSDPSTKPKRKKRPKPKDDEPNPWEDELNKNK